MLASRRVLVLALSALVALARGPIGSLAIESKCTACAAVAAELGGALESERPRNHLDTRERPPTDVPSEAQYEATRRLRATARRRPRRAPRGSRT